MPFASESQVNTVLKPYFNDFVALVHDSHKDWTESSFAASMQDPKVRATLVWNQFLARAKATFEQSDVVRVENKKHWQGLMIGTSFFVRMKKGTKQLLSRNYPTQAALDFNDASVDLFEGVVRLELIYTLDNLESGVDRIVIAQRHRNKILWAIDLLDNAEDHGQTVINMPQAPAGGQTPADRIIKPKKNLEQLPKKRGTNNDGA
jgi:hypothetical protein